MAVEQLKNDFFDDPNINFNYFQKESNYYICSIKMKYNCKDYVFYIKSNTIDFCKFDGYSSNIGKITLKTTVNVKFILFFAKNKINNLIKNHIAELKKINKTHIVIIDGNCKLESNFEHYYSITSHDEWYFNRYTLSLKDKIIKSDKEVIYVLHKKLLYGQSISNRNRKIIIQKLNEHGINNVEFYKED